MSVEALKIIEQMKKFANGYGYHKASDGWRIIIMGVHNYHEGDKNESGFSREYNVYSKEDMDLITSNPYFDFTFSIDERKLYTDLDSLKITFSFFLGTRHE